MTYATKSPWVIHYDGSSCNGCDIEVLAALCPGSMWALASSARATPSTPTSSSSRAA